MNFRKSTIPFLGALILFGTLATPSAAEEGKSWWEAPWRFNVNVYGWMPKAPVTIKVDGAGGDAPEKFDNIFDDLELAAMFEVEVHKGPIGVFASPVYYKGDDAEHFDGLLGQRRKVNLRESVWIVDYGATYAFGPWHLGRSVSMAVEPYAGARFVHDNIEVKLDSNKVTIGPDEFVEPGFTKRKKLSMNAPIIGARIALDVTKRWALQLSGDVGGFHVDGVDSTYQVIGKLNYNYKMWDLSSNVFAGYRHLHLHYDKQGLDVSVTAKGPFVGLGWEF